MVSMKKQYMISYQALRNKHYIIRNSYYFSRNVCVSTHVSLCPNIMTENATVSAGLAAVQDGLCNCVEGV